MNSRITTQVQLPAAFFLCQTRRLGVCWFWLLLPLRLFGLSCRRKLNISTANQLPDSIPPRLKVVVFGATGRIGRRTIKNLMSSPVDMDVVAFVRNKQKLDTVLYNEEKMIASRSG